ncbi:hypothetical protein BY458DRAFT_559427 [Sporodiniella umbellata]|nr:hypothetical protein BY458DRAFT_559427 [Sporodiniella umbellata]
MSRRNKLSVSFMVENSEDTVVAMSEYAIQEDTSRVKFEELYVEYKKSSNLNCKSVLKNDSQHNDLINILKNKEKVNDKCFLYGVKKEYSYDGSTLYFCGKIVVKSEDLYNIILATHKNYGHSGRDITTRVKIVPPATKKKAKCREPHWMLHIVSLYQTNRS